MDFSRLTTPQRISAVSMAVVLLAALLPWVSIFGISARGTDGDGIITLILALVGGVVLALTSGVLGDSRGASSTPTPALAGVGRTSRRS